MGNMGMNIHIGIVQDEFCFQVVLEGLYRVVVEYELLKLFIGMLLVWPVLPALHALTLNRSGKQKSVTTLTIIYVTINASGYKIMERLEQSSLPHLITEYALTIN